MKSSDNASRLSTTAMTTVSYVCRSQSQLLLFQVIISTVEAAKEVQAAALRQAPPVLLPTLIHTAPR